MARLSTRVAGQMASVLALGAVGCQLTLADDGLDDSAFSSGHGRYGGTHIPASPAAAGSGERDAAMPNGTGGTPASADDSGSAEGDDASPDGEPGKTPEAAPPPEPPPPTTPWIFVDELVNARDVGGTNAGDAHVAYRSLFRGPPLRLSPSGCDEFRRIGIRTVLDLRIDSERRSTPESACAASTSVVVSAPLPVPYNVSPEDYIAILDARSSIAKVFATLSAEDRYPVYVHCTYGRDRTGVVVALVLSALGVSRDEILREYLMSRESVGAYPVSLEAALDEVERRGGIEAYLASTGVSEGALANLRKRALVR